MFSHTDISKLENEEGYEEIQSKQKLVTLVEKACISLQECRQLPPPHSKKWITKEITKLDFLLQWAYYSLKSSLITVAVTATQEVIAHIHFLKGKKKLENYN